MSRDLKTFCLRLAALGAAACSSAYAVHSAPEGGALVAPQPMARSPYDVELIGADGRTLETFENGNRFYVLGRAGDRYSIRVNNPTDRRVEALISVDGLDVIDGETADYATKRGYVVPPRGELVVDGFRMSTTQVAAFRFSPVGESYAELKGKGRNVGVIGVAIFEEKQQPQLVAPQPEPAPDRWYGGDRDESRDQGSYAGAEDSAAPATGGGTVSSAPPASPAPPAADPGEAKASQEAPRRSATSRAPAHRLEGESAGSSEPCCGPPRKKERSGLGTQWGEERYSAVDFTSFERASATVPTAMAELRYNDSEGLRALGIQLQPAPDADELIERETADPFPAARGFASPPQ
jgi:hypothetical protein